jgi:hypothetical protein
MRGVVNALGMTELLLRVEERAPEINLRQLFNIQKANPQYARAIGSFARD